MERESMVEWLLRVRGVSGCGMVDASVLPMQPSGNTAAPTVVVAWRGADMITENR